MLCCGPLGSQHFGQDNQAALAALYAERIGQPPSADRGDVDHHAVLLGIIASRATAWVIKNAPFSIT